MNGKQETFEAFKLVLINDWHDWLWISSAEACCISSCSYCIGLTINLTHVFSNYLFTVVIYVIITASWAISVYFAYQRTWKPFNPILGETYEMVNHGGITFLAEQVLSSMWFSWELSDAYCSSLLFLSLWNIVFYVMYASIWKKFYGIFWLGQHEAYGIFYVIFLFYLDVYNFFFFNFKF